MVILIKISSSPPTIPLLPNASFPRRASPFASSPLLQLMSQRTLSAALNTVCNRPRHIFIPPRLNTPPRQQFSSSIHTKKAGVSYLYLSENRGLAQPM